MRLDPGGELVLAYNDHEEAHQVEMPKLMDSQDRMPSSCSCFALSELMLCGVH